MIVRNEIYGTNFFDWGQEGDTRKEESMPGSKEDEVDREYDSALRRLKKP